MSLLDALSQALQGTGNQSPNIDLSIPGSSSSPTGYTLPQEQDPQTFSNPPITADSMPGQGTSPDSIPRSGPISLDEMLTQALAQQKGSREKYLSTFDQMPGTPPSPIHPALRTQDLVAGLLPALLLTGLTKHGAGGAAYAQGYLGGKQQKAQEDTQAANQKFQQQEQMRGQQQQKAAAELGFANQDVATLQQQQQQQQKEKDAEMKQRTAEGKSMRAQYLAANLPGEKQALSRILREQYPEFAPTDQELQRDMETLSRPDAKAFNDSMRHFKETNFFGTDKELRDALDQYSEKRGQLMAAGVPERLLDPVVDVKSLKQFQQESLANARKERLSLAKDRFSFDKRKHSDDLEARWAMIDIAKQNYDLAAQRNQLGYMQFYANQIGSQAKRTADAIGDRVTGLQKEIARQSGILEKAGATPQEIAKDPTIAALSQQIQTYQANLDEQNQTLGDIGQAPLTLPDVLSAAQRGMTGDTTQPGKIARTAGPSPYRSLIQKSAERAGIPAGFLDAVIHAESSYNPSSVSKAGAKGIAQLMPDTADGMGVDPMDPNQAIPAAARILANNLKHYNGDYSLAAAAYNAGVGAVDKYGRVPPYRETQNYVKRVLQLAGIGYDKPAPEPKPDKPKNAGSYRSPVPSKTPPATGGFLSSAGAAVSKAVNDASHGTLKTKSGATFSFGP